MDNFMDAYFGPLGKEYCVYFYVLSIIFGITFVLSAISIGSFMVMHHKRVDATFIANSFLIFTCLHQVALCHIIFKV